MRNRTLIAYGVSLSSVLAVAVALLEPSVFGRDAEAQLNPQQTRRVAFTLDCTAPAKPISPLIYGIGGSDNPWSTGTTAIRVGGNPASRYNWELDTWNAASDWFFKNTGGAHPGLGQDQMLAEGLKRDVKVTLT